MSHTKKPRPARATLSIPLLLLPLALSAAEYKWTGAVSSDFTDADNWLVASGDSWAATATPPTNGYGYDDIVFDGVAAECPHMPVLSTNYTLRRIFFRSGGWTLEMEEGVVLDLVHGSGGNWQGQGVNTGNEISIWDESGDGLTNVVRGTLHYIPGCSFSSAADSVLQLDVTINLDRGAYGGNQMEYSFTGAGTFLLTGAVYDTDAQKCIVNGPTIIMDASSGVALEGPVNFRSGKLIAKRDGQLTGNLYLTGNASIDFGDFASTVSLYFGGAQGSDTTGVAWTGNICGTSKVRVSENGHIAINPTALPVVLDGGVLGYSKWHGTNQYLDIGDIPNEDVDLVVQGPLFTDRSGNNGCTAHFRGRTCDGETTYGTISLNAATGFGGNYSKANIETTVFVNDTGVENKSALGSPISITVNAPTGVLRGNGILMPYTGNNKESSNPTVDIYGILAPGSLANPSATLTIQRSYNKNAVTTTMHQGSVFRVSADGNGALPAVEQKDGTFTLEAATAATTDPDTGDEIPAVPGVTLHITGDTPPAEGVVHRILTAPTLTGRFDEVVVDFSGAKGYNCEVLYGTNYVDFRCSKCGTVVLFR